MELQFGRLNLLLSRPRLPTLHTIELDNGTQCPDNPNDTAIRRFNSKLLERIFKGNAELRSLYTRLNGVLNADSEEVDKLINMVDRLLRGRNRVSF